MRKISLLGMGIVVGLAGCAAQTPVDQLSPRPETIRLCQGSQCAQVPASTTTLQKMPVDVAAQQRYYKLVQLAEQDARAAYDLGVRLLRGDGVERNGYDAMQWLRKAGDNGLMQAQLALGQLYVNGWEEMGADPAEAEVWLTRAATQGSQEAKLLLPKAQQARQQAQDQYAARQAERERAANMGGNGWIYGNPYYWQWNESGSNWHLR